MQASLKLISLLSFAAILAGCDNSDNSGKKAKLNYNNFQEASVVLGQEDFNRDLSLAASAQDLAGAWGPVTFINKKLYVPIYSQSRVLIFDGIPDTNYAAASDVLGQFNLDSDVAETSATGMNGPVSAFSDGEKLLIAEYSNNRVLIYNSIPESGSPGTADVVVGQPDLDTTQGRRQTNCSASGLDNPYNAIITDNGKLVINDAANHRVLIWNSVPTSNGQAADIVVGQADMQSCDRNAGGSITASSFSTPTGMWTNGGQLFVADSSNNRVMVWNQLPTTNNQAADWIIGQDDFNSNESGVAINRFSFSEPVLHSDGKRLCLTDDKNARVLIWDTLPTENDKNPDVVLGQSNFDRNIYNDDDQDGVSDGQPSARTLYYPSGCTFINKQLVVTDYSNNRVLIFNAERR